MTVRRPSPPPPRAPTPGRPLRERLQSTLFEGETQVPQARSPISISELTEKLSRHIAIGFSSVCVMGEVSQVKVVASGHTYFTLKDSGATLDAMVWADRKAGLTVEPRPGLRVIAVGALRVFAASGRYSLHVDALEPVGAGDLQRALEALKARLLAEGLFAESRKRALPTLLHTVGLVTSPTGAVRHDIERTLTKGGVRLHLLLSPTRVQGEGSALEIATAIRLLAERPEVDVIIVARGGGSVEELWPFNDEAVARAIAASRPPVISAVGHETDFTVADLVADVRASTPSVAAGLVVDIQRRAAERTQSAAVTLRRAIEAARDRWRRRLDAVSTHRVMDRERTKLERLRGQVAATLARARVAADRRQAARLGTFRDLATRCEAHAPREIFGRAHARIDRALLSMHALVTAQVDRKRTRRFAAPFERLVRSLRPAVEARRGRFVGAMAKLEALSPLAVLSRGYALATTPSGRILLNANDVSPGDAVVVRLSSGRLRTTVTSREEEAP